MKLKKWLVAAAHLLMILTLTLLTQIGGLVYLVMIIIQHQFKWYFKKTMLIFTAAYIILSLLVLPIIAPAAGRVALPMTGKLRPHNWLTCLLNRHYVTLPLRDQLIATATQLSADSPFADIVYLDANFPFWDGFPLFPHLSHSDGQKVDLAFYYQDLKTGKVAAGSPSWTGYGVCEQPEAGETNYPEICTKKGHWAYSFMSRWTTQPAKSQVILDEASTQKLLLLLTGSTATSKIFLEPHLKSRWQLDAQQKIRFHGCQAVRHDDHIHLEVSP